VTILPGQVWKNQWNHCVKIMSVIRDTVIVKPCRHDGAEIPSRFRPQAYHTDRNSFGREDGYQLVRTPDSYVQLLMCR